MKISQAARECAARAPRVTPEQLAIIRQVFAPRAETSDTETATAPGEGDLAPRKAS